MQLETFKRELWIIEYLMEYGPSTKAQIQRAWERTDMIETNGYNLGHHLKDYLNKIGDLFHIDIEVDVPRSNYGKYRITNPEFFRRDSFYRWVVKSLIIRNDILHCSMFQKRFMLDDFPSGYDCIHRICKAMKQRRMLDMSYCTYNSDTPSQYFVAPYAVKTYKHRFYMLGRYLSGKFSMFAFDRIKDMEITSTKFEDDETFDVETFFAPYYGVMLGTKGLNIENVVVRAFGNAPHYLRDVPMHTSQKEIGSGDGFVDFQYTLYPTDDFIGDIIQQIDRLEVRSPYNVRERVIEKIQSMQKLYKI